VTTQDEQLRAVERASDAARFATVIAHELASSLLVVSRVAESLQGDRGLSDEQADQVDRIVRVSDRMRRTISSARYLFTDYTELEPDEVALAEIVDEALDMLSPLIEEREPEIVVPEELPVVTGVPVHLAQLISNLLSNAIKYGPERHGRVELTVTARGTGWRIAVSDQGPGIAPEYHDSIFEPFRRLRGTGHLPGTGLGLTICRRIAESHGGTLTLDSSPGRGTTFVFMLPDLGAMDTVRTAARYALAP
jgi:signal transduction histidine kinase